MVIPYWGELEEKAKRLFREEDIDGLIEFISECWHVQQRERVLYKLGLIGDPRAIDTLMHYALGSEHYGRNTAWNALCRMGPLAVDPVIQTLQDERSFIRYDAARILGCLKDTRAIEPLLAALHDEKIRVQNGAIGALSNFNDPRVVEALLEKMKERLFLSIARILGKFGDERIVPFLQSVIQNPSTHYPDNDPEYTKEIAEKALREYYIELKKLEK